MSLVTQPALETPKDVTNLEHRTSSFADLTFPRPAPWLYSALEQLWNLEFNGRNIDGLGDFRIAVHTATRVRKMLFRIGNTRSLPAPRVAVISGGGVSLKWSIGAREVTYTFWPEGVLTYDKESGGDIVDENEFANDEPFNPKEPVEWLLNA